MSQQSPGAKSDKRGTPYYGENEELERIERDKKDFVTYFKEHTDMLQKEFKEEKEPIIRLWHSFDEDVLREWYDDIGPMSDFQSDISHDSFPHHSTKIKAAEYQARLEIFRLHLKTDNNFNNLYV